MDLVNLSDKARIAWRLVRSPPVEIRLSGSAEARAQYAVFTRKHRRLPFLPNKTFGVALFRLPEGGDPFGSPQFKNLRTRRKRTLARGYTFAPFEGRDYADRILEIHRSSPLRQGKPLPATYTDENFVRLYCEKRRPFFGAFDSENVLRAYCHAPTLGEVTMFARFFGDHERLNDGIMYFLYYETVTAIAAARGANAHPHWIMYDTYVGGGPGMRLFKQLCGFQPYRVKWMLPDDPA